MGVLNDVERKAQLFLDKEFLDAPGLIGVHPNENTATIWLRAEDLIRVIQAHGTIVHMTEI